MTEKKKNKTLQTGNPTEIGAYRYHSWMHVHVVDSSRQIKCNLSIYCGDIWIQALVLVTLNNTEAFRMEDLFPDTV